MYVVHVLLTTAVDVVSHERGVTQCFALGKALHTYLGISPSKILQTVPAMFIGTSGTSVRKFRRTCSKETSMYRSNSSTSNGRYSFASLD
jgi:hypothetical protein